MATDWYYIPWRYIHYRPIIICMARPYKNSSEHLELLKFGNSVRILRLDKDISQEKLSELAGIDRSYMGGIERGEYNLSLVNIKRISDALEVSIFTMMKAACL